MSSGLLALVVTLASVYTMQSLLEHNGQAPKYREALATITFSDIDIPEKPVKKPPPKPKPPEPKELPQPNTTIPVNQPVVQPVNIDYKGTRGDKGQHFYTPTSNFKQAAISSGLLPLITPDPPYPRNQQIKGIEGWVKVEITVDKQGKVAEVKVIDHYPDAGFDQAAIRAVSKWLFKPQLFEGKPQIVKVVQQIDFTLDS